MRSDIVDSRAICRLLLVAPASSASFLTEDDLLGPGRCERSYRTGISNNACNISIHYRRGGGM